MLHVAAELSVPVLAVSIAVILAMCVVLVLCVCGKQKSTLSENNEGAEATRISTFLDAETLRKMQTEDKDTDGPQIDIETGITPLNHSVGENGAVHSRGNSVDLTKGDRNSGISTGSSPRPTTLSRELPDIPIKNKGSHSTLPDRGHHSTLPDIPSESGHKKGSHSTLPSSSRTSALSDKTGSRGVIGDVTRKAGHSHTQLPEIPKHDGIKTSPNLQRPKENGSVAVTSGESLKTDSDGMDDYDHIEETSKKKTRPRSDYDHVVIEGGEKKILLAKSKLNENDYAEVQADEDTVSTTQEVTVIPVSKPLNTSQHKTADKSPVKPVHKTDSFDDPYNKIKGDDLPYNRIKDDPPYNKIKEAEASDIKDKYDPYNKITVDDPYNFVKDDMEDLDPYNTVNDGSNSARSSVRHHKHQHFSFKGAFYDPYAMVTDEERNVSNQTDPYARVGDTELEVDDPYNKVVEDSDAVTSAVVTSKSAKTYPQYSEQDYATVNKVEYAKVNKTGTKKTSESVSTEVADQDGDLPSPREEIVHDEYATVVKVKKLSVGNSSKSNDAGSASSAKPVSDTSVVSVSLSPQAEGVSSRANLDIPLNRSSAWSLMTQSWTGGVSSRNVVMMPGIRQQQIGASGMPGTSEQEITAAGVPPEPPRDYSDDIEGMDGDHYNTVAAVSHDRNSDQPGMKKEPPYNKLSVRESLASMNARAAANTYEYVSEVDNLYATVDGSSGDGVVGRTRQLGAAEQQLPTADYYTEIDAPAPPSLDSLHETAKQHQDEIRRKHDKKPNYYNFNDGPKSPSKTPGHQRTPSGQGEFVQGHSRTPSGQGQLVQGHSRTPSGQGQLVQGHSRNSAEVMSSSFEGRVPIATAENVDLEFQNYNAANDNKIPDNISEFDPNYETVDEAKAKLRYAEVNGARPKETLIRPHIYEVPDSDKKFKLKDGETVLQNGKIRAHVYEEVKEPSEARRIKQRVLSRHTYEEVTDTTSADKSAKQQQNVTNNSQNKNKDDQRSSSGEWSLFGKKKIGNEKDKSKESKGDKKAPVSKNKGEKL